MTIDTLAERIEPLAKLATWLKGLFVGAFLLGMWAATLQAAVFGLQKDVAKINTDREASLVEWRSWRERIERSMARQEALMEQLVKK